MLNTYFTALYISMDSVLDDKLRGFSLISFIIIVKFILIVLI